MLTADKPIATNTMPTDSAGAGKTSSPARKPKIVIVMPAYNAAPTLEKTYYALPQGSYDQIILVDDASLTTHWKSHRSSTSKPYVTVRTAAMAAIRKLLRQGAGRRRGNHELESVNFEANSENFVFDNEILVQFVIKNMRFKEIPVSTRYSFDFSSVSFKAGVVYGLSILRTIIKYMLFKWGFIRYKQFS